MAKQATESDKKSESINLEELLREKEKLDSLIKRKFTRTITVMFTDLSGSTQMSEELGDITWRGILKNHNDILFPIIKSNNGHLVKTMGDGTMSYFQYPSDAVQAAIDIEHGIHKYNTEKDRTPLLIRCGLNTGMGIVEKLDVYGDVVNVAQRFEALAGPKQILIAEDTYDAIKDNKEFCVCFYKETRLRGKVGPQKAFRVFWDPEEIEKFKAGETAIGEAMERPNGTGTAGMPVEWNRENPPTGAITMRASKGARLMVEQKGRAPTLYNLEMDNLVIGRSKQASIQLSEIYVSRQHAKVFRESGKYFMEDMGSNIGTLHKGRKITRREMKEGDEFIIGSFKLIFLDSAVENVNKANEVDSTEATMLFEPGQLVSIVVEDGGATLSRYQLTENPLVIGRTEKCDIRLKNPMVSRRHASVYMEGTSAFVEDASSNNGTFVNGRKITKAEIGVNDEINIGTFVLRLEDPTSLHSQHGAPHAFSFTRKMMSYLSKK